MLMCVHGDGLFGPNTEDSDVVQKSVKCFVEKFWLQTGMLNPQDMCYVFAPITNPRWHLSNILLLEDLQLTATHNDCELNKRKFDCEPGFGCPEHKFVKGVRVPVSLPSLPSLPVPLETAFAFRFRLRLLCSEPA